MGLKLFGFIVVSSKIISVYKFKFKIIYIYAVALLYTFFFESINNSTLNKHSLEVLQRFVIVHINSV